MPENIPRAEHIKLAKKRIDNAATKLQLAEAHAKGLGEIPPENYDLL